MSAIDDLAVQLMLKSEFIQTVSVAVAEGESGSAWILTWGTIHTHELSVTDLTAGFDAITEAETYLTETLELTLLSYWVLRGDPSAGYKAIATV